MAASIAVTGSGEYLTPFTVTISGCGANTAHTLLVTQGGGQIQTLNVTTDSSGAATVKVTKIMPGQWSFALRPQAECNCTTAATATMTRGGAG
jgi:hypothetical protein